MSYVTRLLRAAGLLLGLACLAAGAVADPVARQGVMDVPAASGEVIELRGEWSFAWGRFTDPAQAAPVAPFAQVPGSWAGGADGYATYSLDVRCPPGEKLVIAMPVQRTAYRLFVNGELATSQGTPAAAADAAHPAIGGRVNVTAPFACPLRVVAHVSNFSHRAGGMVRAPSIGTHAALLGDVRGRLVLDTVLLGVYLVLGIVPCIFFLARRKDPVPLQFGVFCLVLALYSDMTGERLLLQLFGSETGWEIYLRIEYLAWFGSMAAFLVFVRSLFGPRVPRMPLLVLLGACAACAAAVAVTPARWYSHLAPVGQAVVLAAALVAAWAFLVAARAGHSGARIMLGGMAIAVALVAVDVLRYDVATATRSITPFGLLAFVLAPAIVLARRLARALNAEELRGLEQRLRGDLLVRTTKAGIYDWDTTTNETTYSDRLKEILGYPPDADTSKWPVFYHFIHPADRDNVQARFLQQLRDCRVASGEMRHAPYEYRLVRADGRTVWVMAEAISLTGSDCRTLRYVCSFIDVTERHQMQEDVERIARHDLKTPLNSIIGVTRLLRDDPSLGQDQRELLGIADRAGYRMLEMVNLSLGLYKMESGSYEFRPQAVALGEVVERVLVDLRGLADANKVRLQVWGDGAAQVYARAEELLCYSILANVVKNAIEATPAGGKVTVALDAGPPVCVHVHNPGRVPPEVAAHFFAKYATAGKSGGTGLGAYSARLMARAQEGDLAMTSSDADGTRLTLTLRSLPADAALHGRDPTVTVRTQLLPAVQMAPAHVLVVDDDEYNRLILRRYLPTPPLTVETAVNGRAAIDAAMRRWPDFIVIDMEMPVMGGVEAVTWIRRREQQEGRARTSIVMASSNDDEVSIHRCLAAGADRYLTKPVTREALLATLQELAGSPQSAPAAPKIAPIQVLPAREEEVAVDPDLLPEVPAFLASRQELLRAMGEALAAGDRERLRGLAHRTGGALALYGFTWAAWQSRELELKAMEGDAAALQGGIESLAQYLKEVRFRPVQ